MQQLPLQEDVKLLLNYMNFLPPGFDRDILMLVVNLLSYISFCFRQQNKTHCRSFRLFDLDERITNKHYFPAANLNQEHVY